MTDQAGDTDWARDDPGRRRPLGRPSTSETAIGVSEVDDDASPAPAPVSGRFYVSPGRSALLRWRVVTASVVFFAVVAALIAGLRHPTYTSTSSLYVGRTLSLTQTAAIPGLSAAATTIAQDYSRLITTTPVTSQAAALTGRKGRGVDGSLDASVVAETPEILITANSGTASGAESLAAAGSKSLIAAVDKLNQASASTLSGLRNSYTSLERSINADTQRQQQVQSELDSALGGDSSQSTISSLQRTLTNLETQIATDQLDASSVENQYSTEYSPLTQETQVLNSIGPATPASSDRKKSLEIGLIAGVVVGLIFGIAVASLYDLRRDRHLAAYMTTV